MVNEPASLRCDSVAASVWSCMSSTCLCVSWLTSNHWMQRSHTNHAGKQPSFPYIHTWLAYLQPTEAVSDSCNVVSRKKELWVKDSRTFMLSEWRSLRTPFVWTVLPYTLAAASCRKWTNAGQTEYPRMRVLANGWDRGKKWNTDKVTHVVPAVTAVMHI